MDVGLEVRSLSKRLAAEGTPARAAGAKRYLKSELAFLGVTVPVIRREAKAFARARDDLDRRTLRALCEQLWASDVHELRSIAIGILEARSELLKAPDATWLIGLVRRADTWAHVDWLATKVLGALVAREPSVSEKLERWAADPSFWVRRSALLALHDPIAAGTGDFDHLARLAVPLLGEREFFIRKAIGWMLREACKRTPQKVIEFVARHGAQMSALSFKEATRRLPAADARRLRALRDAPPPEQRGRQARGKRTRSPG